MLTVFVALQDLTHSMRRVCVADLKMGTRQHGEEEPPHKAASKIKKCTNSTSSRVGFRIGGIKVTALETPAPYFVSKYTGRTFDLHQLYLTLSAFFTCSDPEHLDQEGLSKLISIRLKEPRVLARVRSAMHKVRALAESVVSIDRLDAQHVADQRRLRLYASSILIAYDDEHSPSIQEPAAENAFVNDWRSSKLPILNCADHQFDPENPDESLSQFIVSAESLRNLGQRDSDSDIHVKLIDFGHHTFSFQQSLEVDLQTPASQLDIDHAVGSSPSAKFDGFVFGCSQLIKMFEQMLGTS